ncbi:MAG: zinc transporter ZupT [Elusimicrobiaceae bacterium]|nr:zinc transporter ZupT [Elusimicrobiaceae bacterium]
MNEPIFCALFLSFLAGAATSIGGLLSFVVKKDNFAALALGLGFSAGVMIYVSFMEMMPEAKASLAALYGPDAGAWLSVGLFFGGVMLAWLIDRFMPSHHIQADALEKKNKLKHLGLFTALALAIHNFPEGLATFMATMENMTLGISIAIAVAVHNIPEGIAVALPVYHATGSKGKAFLYSTFSGMAEPLGALLGFLIFRYFLHEGAFGVMFALVAGIMVYISLDELLPTAHEYADGHHVIWGVIGGMMIMALSLLIF